MYHHGSYGRAAFGGKISSVIRIVRLGTVRLLTTVREHVLGSRRGPAQTLLSKQSSNHVLRSKGD